MSQHALIKRLLILVTLLSLVACGSSQTSQPVTANKTPKTYADLVIGYSQIGAESRWRTANTLSIQESAQDLGIDLRFADAQQEQINQINAIRSFITQKVDLIGVSPIVADGWDEVFAEAKAAGIPIIVVDRTANVPNDLITAFIGSDFVLEGERACEEMAQLLNQKGTIIELEGTVGSAPARDRKTGFHNCLKKYPEMQVLVSKSGDFTRAQGKTVLQGLIKQYGTDFDAIYAHNDDMALGAIELLKELGIKPGVEVKIVSIDAVEDAFKAMIAGDLNVTVECNPLLGPQFFETALKIVNGEPFERWVKSNEGIFRQATATQDLPKRRY